MTLDASSNLGVGTTSPATKLHISTDGTYDPLRLQSTQSGYERSWTIGPNVGANGFFVIRDSTAGANRLAIDTNGNLIQSAPTTAPTLSTNGTMVFNLTSNTNLRVSVRGSDGVTRTANLTLA